MKYGENGAQKFDEHKQSRTPTPWLLGYDQITQSIGDWNGLYVLDYGCGTGVYTEELSNRGARMIGVDISEEMLEVATSKNIAHTGFFQLADYVPDATMDVAVANLVFCEIEDEMEARKAMQYVYESLRPGGTFFLLQPNHDVYQEREFISWRTKPDVEIHGKVHVTLKTGGGIHLEDYVREKDEYVRMMDDLDFSEIKVREFYAGDAAQQAEWKDEIHYPPTYIISAKKL